MNPVSARIGLTPWPAITSRAHQKMTPGHFPFHNNKRSLLFSRCAVKTAAVAYIASVGPDLNTGRLALLTYRAIVFHAGSLLVFLIHGD